MAAFTPASSDVWTLGYDQSGRSCWQNKQTQQLRYSPPGQGLPPLPPRDLMDAPPTKVPSDSPLPPPPIPSDRAFPVVAQPQGFGQGVQFHASPFKAPEPTSALPASIEVGTKPSPSPFKAPEPTSALPASIGVGTKPGPSPPVSRAEEAKQWSRKRDDRGEYYFNSVTMESQFAKPDCLKKYTSRR